MSSRAAILPKLIAVGTALLALGLINLAIVRSQAVLRDGPVFYLELAPVDPRSLLQGDYMALNYKVANDLRSSWPEDLAHAAWVRLSLDQQRIAGSPELSAERPQAGANQIVLRVRRDGWRVIMATDGYFFEEGQGQRYEAARYGRFHSDGVDKALLSALVGEDLNEL